MKKVELGKEVYTTPGQRHEREHKHKQEKEQKQQRTRGPVQVASTCKEYVHLHLRVHAPKNAEQMYLLHLFNFVLYTIFAITRHSNGTVRGSTKFAYTSFIQKV